MSALKSGKKSISDPRKETELTSLASFRIPSLVWKWRILNGGTWSVVSLCQYNTMVCFCDQLGREKHSLQIFFSNSVSITVVGSCNYIFFQDVQLCECYSAWICFPNHLASLSVPHYLLWAWYISFQVFPVCQSEKFPAVRFDRFVVAQLPESWTDSLLTMSSSMDIINLSMSDRVSSLFTAVLACSTCLATFSSSKSLICCLVSSVFFTPSQHMVWLNRMVLALPDTLPIPNQNQN